MCLVHIQAGSDSQARKVRLISRQERQESQVATVPARPLVSHPLASPPIPACLTGRLDPVWTLPRRHVPVPVGVPVQTPLRPTDSKYPNPVGITSASFWNLVSFAEPESFLP